jgi:hypothetical protein
MTTRDGASLAPLGLARPVGGQRAPTSGRILSHAEAADGSPVQDARYGRSGWLLSGLILPNWLQHFHDQSR